PEALLPHLPDVRQGDNVRREPLAQPRDLRREALERPLPVEDAEARQRRGARERIPGEGVPVEEGAKLLVGCEESGENVLGRDRRGERQVAAAESLRDAEQVRRDAGVLACEHPAGAAEPGRDLVCDEERTVTVRELVQRA